jgi:hypothetical protein
MISRLWFLQSSTSRRRESDGEDKSADKDVNSEESQVPLEVEDSSEETLAAEHRSEAEPSLQKLPEVKWEWSRGDARVVAVPFQKPSPAVSDGVESKLSPKRRVPVNNVAANDSRKLGPFELGNDVDVTQRKTDGKGSPATSDWPLLKAFIYLVSVAMICERRLE